MDKETKECDGGCGRVFIKTDLLTVPTSGDKRVCDRCAEKYFNIPIDDEDSIPTPVDE